MTQATRRSRHPRNSAIRVALASEEFLDPNSKLNPAVQAIDDNIDKRLLPLADLESRIGKLEGRIDQLNADQKRLTSC